MRELVIGFLLGAIITAGGAFWYETRQTQEFANALALLKSGEYATEYTRAMAAYRREEPTIAIWELNHLVDLEREQLRVGVETNGALAGLMLTRARLAKLYDQEGREAEAQTNAQEAISLMQKLPAPDETVTNLSSLLARLRVFDARESERRSRE